jgi:pimeloyl-ACP methyl ester carboxylesterase
MGALPGPREYVFDEEDRVKSIGRIAAGLVVAALAAGTAACGVSATTPPTAQPPGPGQQGGPGRTMPIVQPTVGLKCKAAWAGGTQVGFLDSAGVYLGGVELGTGTKGVVLAHQAGGDACQWLPFGRQLAAAGYRVLAFDFAGSGVSGPLANGDKRDDNVVAAAAYLHGHGVLSVVLIGASMGGNASLVAAPRVMPPVNGVISLSAPVDYDGLDASGAAPKLSVPALYIAGAREAKYADAARTLYAATPGDTKTLLLASGDQHGVALLEKAEPDAAKVRKAILDFLKAHAPV